MQCSSGRDNLRVTLLHAVLDGRADMVVEQWWTRSSSVASLSRPDPNSVTILSRAREGCVRAGAFRRGHGAPPGRCLPDDGTLRTIAHSDRAETDAPVVPLSRARAFDTRPHWAAVRPGLQPPRTGRRHPVAEMGSGCDNPTVLVEGHLYGERVWFSDTRSPVRRMGISTHPVDSTIVISLWQGDVCTGTFRLPASDAAGVISTLAYGMTEAIADPDRTSELAVRTTGAVLVTVLPALVGTPAASRSPPQAAQVADTTSPRRSGTRRGLWVRSFSGKVQRRP